MVVRVLEVELDDVVVHVLDRPLEAGLLGGLAIPGAVAGVAIVNVVPERAVELAFAALLVIVAARLVTGRE